MNYELFPSSRLPGTCSSLLGWKFKTKPEMVMNYHYWLGGDFANPLWDNLGYAIFAGSAAYKLFRPVLPLNIKTYADVIIYF